MKTASASKVAAQFNDFLDASQEQPVLVTRNGKPVAVLMAVRNKAEAEQLAASPPRSLRSIFQKRLRKSSSRPGEFRTRSSGNRSRAKSAATRRKPHSEQEAALIPVASRLGTELGEVGPGGGVGDTLGRSLAVISVDECFRRRGLGNADLR